MGLLRQLHRELSRGGGARRARRCLQDLLSSRTACKVLTYGLIQRARVARVLPSAVLAVGNVMQQA